MTIIVAGRFDTDAQAQDAVQALTAHGFHHDDTSKFFVNPAGQHDRLPIGGDQPADAEASKAHVGAVAGAAAGAAAGGAAALAAASAIPLVGPVLGLGVVALGAYTGSLVGTLAKLGDPQAAAQSDASPGREGGPMVAVRGLNEEAERIALDVLRAKGAMDIERREGVWQDGEWKDFDPVVPPATVEPRRS
jgi:hypothetical protein